MKQAIKKILLVAIIGAAIFGAFPASEVHAADPYSIEELTNNFADCGGWGASGKEGDHWMKFGAACILSTVLQLIVLAVLYGIGLIFSILLTGFAYASIGMIKLGIGITTKLGAIPVGFEMALGVANILFVIAIILIAFSTVLRWHEYEAKKLLPRLIFAALLVNFSLLIASVMLDASNVFTNYFLNHFNADSIGAALDPQKQIFVAPPGQGDHGRYTIGGGEHSWEHFFVIFPRVLFAIIITFVMMVAMLAVFVMALVRNIWVVVLLVTMPLAWGSWVIPKLEGYWKKWWENFINWGVLYLPIVTFFLYLAFKTLKFKDAAVGDIIPVASQSNGIGSFLNQALSEAVGSLIVIGLVIGGLKIAQSLGSNIAGSFANLAGRGGRKLAGGLLKTSAMTVGATIGTAGGAARGLISRNPVTGVLKGAKSGFSGGTRAPEAAVRASAGILAKTLGFANRLPIIGALTNPMAAALGGAANSQAGLEEVQKRWAGLKGDALKSALVNTMRGAGTATEKAAALAQLAKDHNLEWLSDEKDPARVLAAVKTLKSMSPNTAPRRNATLKAIAGYFTELAPQITGELPREAQRRQNNAEMRAHDAKHVAHDLDGYTAAQLMANASASGKNYGIIKAAVASAIAGSKAFEGDGAMKDMVDKLESTNAALEKIGNKIDRTSLSERSALSETREQLVLDISSRIDDMTDSQRAALKSIDKERLQKWERLKRTVGSAEPAEHGDAHGGHEKTTFGGIRESVGKDMSLGDVKSGGGHGGGEKHGH